MLTHIRKTVISGIVAFLPIFVLVFVAVQTFGALNGVLGPLIDRLDIDRRFVGLVLFLLSAFGVLAIVYGLGLIARFGFIAGWLKRIERGIASRVPTYGFIKSIVTGVVEDTASDGFLPISVTTPLGTRIGFQVDKLADGRIVVFLPDAPNPRSGNTLIVDPQHCTLLDMPSHKVFEALSSYGRGLGDLSTAPSP